MASGAPAWGYDPRVQKLVGLAGRTRVMLVASQDTHAMIPGESLETEKRRVGRESGYRHRLLLPQRMQPVEPDRGHVTGDRMGRDALRGHRPGEAPGRQEAAIVEGAVQRAQRVTVGIVGRRQPESAAGESYDGGALLNERTSVDHVAPSSGAPI